MAEVETFPIACQGLILDGLCFQTKQVESSPGGFPPEGQALRSSFSYRSGQCLGDSGLGAWFSEGRFLGFFFKLDCLSAPWLGAKIARHAEQFR